MAVADTEVMRIFVRHNHEDDGFCRELTSAMRHVGTDVWYDEHNMGAGSLLDTIELELRARPVFVVILSPPALASAWVRDECKWAFLRLRQDPRRLILPVLAAPVEKDAIWLFLQDFKRIEKPNGHPYPGPEAIQRTLHALALTPTDPNTSPSAAQAEPMTYADLLMHGKALEAQHKFAEAFSVFQQALEVVPGALLARRHLGYVQVELARDADALVTTAQVLELDPNDAFSWRNRANALNGLGRNGEALEAIEHALLLDPQDDFAWLYKGIALTHLQRSDDALVAFDRALSLDPGLHVAWMIEATLLRALNRDEEAATALARAQALDPTNAYAWPARTHEMRLKYLGRVAGLPI